MPEDPVPAPPSTKPPAPGPLPDKKYDLACLAIAAGTPSYEAWDMTIPQLTELLKGA